MSNRTLVEMNHDYCPRNGKELELWAAQMRMYMSSGDKKLLPAGVTFKHMRHHSEPDPLGAAAPSLPSEEIRMLFFYIRNLSHEAWRDPKNAEALFRRIEGYAIKGYEALSSDKVSKEVSKNES